MTEAQANAHEAAPTEPTELEALIAAHGPTYLRGDSDITYSPKLGGLIIPDQLSRLNLVGLISLNSDPADIEKYKQRIAEIATIKDAHQQADQF